MICVLFEVGLKNKIWTVQLIIKFIYYFIILNDWAILFCTK